MSSIENRPAGSVAEPQGFLPKPCTAAWAALIGLALFTYRLGAYGSGRLLMGAALCLTLLKGQLVVDYFMGLRSVRPFWRIAMAAYLIVVGGVIAVAYLSA